jgi:hypothetical protein
VGIGVEERVGVGVGVGIGFLITFLGGQSISEIIDKLPEV